MPNTTYLSQTDAIRAGQQRTPFGEHSDPIYLTSGYVFDNAAQAAARFAGEDDGNIYGRLTNPNVQAFENRLAALDGGRYCVAVSSGMAAITTILMALLQSGDHVVASNSMFGSTMVLLNQIFSKFGVSVSYVALDDVNGWQQATTKQTKLYLLETPSNPLCAVADIKALSDLARSQNVLSIIDNTYCTPVLQKPLALGADMVLYSATKYLEGQGRSLSGAVVTNNEEIYDKVFSVLRTSGPVLSPMNAWLVYKGMETLHLRMKAHSDNAMAVAHWLQAHEQVEQVYYPGLTSHPHHALAAAQQTAFSGMLSFTVRGGREQAWQVIDRCKMISIAVNLGDVKSIITHPASTSHLRITPEERAAAGVTENLIRLSVGLENIDDILTDLSLGLNSVNF